jgi:FHS family L-fucose permease-like MFS transporter
MAVTRTSIVPSMNERRLAFVLVTFLFLLWGLSYGLLDVLNKHFQETLHVTRAQSGLLQMAYFGAYFLLALPAAALLDRFGYKHGMLLGLFLFAVGALLFVPATQTPRFSPYLLAVFVIASGLACLETAANPYMTSLGEPSRAAWRLNLAQSLNGLGQFLGPLLGGALFFSANSAGDSQAPVRATYVFIAAVVLIVAAVMVRTPMPDVRQQERLAVTRNVSLLRQRHFVFAVVAQFFYVAAQVGVGAFFINFATEHGDGISSQRAAFLLSIAMLCFLGGRFAGTAILARVAAAKLLGLYGTAAVALSIIVAMAWQRVSVIALIVLFFFMSIMFPTIFALGVRGLGDQTRRGASFLIMSIVGGAIAPVAMGSLADRSTTALAYLIPAACFAVVTWYGFAGARNSR